jgi:uncharacterized membrane protein YraQ (UPF0718 family)
MGKPRKSFIRRYAFAFAAALVLAAMVLFWPALGLPAAGRTLGGFKEMLLVLPPIFVMLGLLDVWVPRATMVRFMGDGSGIKGALLALFLGSAAAGPLYAAFPVAIVFMKKGAKFMNVVLFLGAWSTTKVPMVLFELASMGPLFTFTRLGLSLVGITIIALLVTRFTGKTEIARIYENAKDM